nr:MAG TPA: hypothetical protein [Caudoviricetes sp.]
MHFIFRHPLFFSCLRALLYRNFWVEVVTYSLL